MQAGRVESGDQGETGSPGEWAERTAEAGGSNALPTPSPIGLAPEPLISRSAACESGCPAERGARLCQVLLSHLVPGTALRGWSYYYSHLLDEETGTKNLSQLSTVVRIGRRETGIPARLVRHQSLAVNHSLQATLIKMPTCDPERVSRSHACM